MTRKQYQMFGVSPIAFKDSVTKLKFKYVGHGIVLNVCIERKLFKGEYGDIEYFKLVVNGIKYSDIDIEGFWQINLSHVLLDITKTIYMVKRGEIR